MENKNAVIVGGGPAGLATALMLAKRGWNNIIVLEKRSSASNYEIDKSYSYLIDGRGQKILDYLELTDKLARISVPSSEFYLTQIKPDGSRKTSKLPIIDPNKKTAYWLPRREFLNLLFQEIKENWQAQITVLFNTKCIEIHQNETNLEIIASQEQNDNILKFQPHFLVGCDGINSIIRQTLAQWDDSQSNRFEMKKFTSPSAGLKYKVLMLPSKFPLDSDKKELSESTKAYAIKGLKNNQDLPLSLGILPVKNPEIPRNANIIRRDNDKIWELKTDKAVLNFLEKTFPQLQIQEIISSEEAARFANSKGGHFPNPQHCSGFYFLLENNHGIVLLGDAIHSFPPDIGQGVNSALEDVLVLKESLDTSNDEDLYTALPLYEFNRYRDTEALIEIVRFAYPYQYNQDPIAKKFWSINFILRLSLSKIIPFLISPPAFFLIQNHQLSYKEILHKVQTTSRYLYLLGGLSLLILCGFLLNLISFTPT